jgi:hypothetical protein
MQKSLVSAAASSEKPHFIQSYQTELSHLFTFGLISVKDYVDMGDFLNLYGM